MNDANRMLIFWSTVSAARTSATALEAGKLTDSRKQARCQELCSVCHQHYKLTICEANSVKGQAFSENDNAQYNVNYHGRKPIQVVPDI